jgi:hypothetical protein
MNPMMNTNHHMNHLLLLPLHQQLTSIELIIQLLMHYYLLTMNAESNKLCVLSIHLLKMVVAHMAMVEQFILVEVYMEVVMEELVEYMVLVEVYMEVVLGQLVEYMVLVEVHIWLVQNHHLLD